MIDSRPYQAVLTRLYEDGVSDHEIARRIGFSAPCVRRIRIGVTRSLHPETAHAIACLLERKSA
jgi:hypothetical protein